MQSKEYKELLQYIEDLEKRVDKLEGKNKRPRKSPWGLERIVRREDWLIKAEE